MIDQQGTTNWTKAHFVCYVFLCVADSDLNIEETELEELKRALKSTLDGEFDFGVIIRDVISEVGMQTYEEKKLFISSNKSRFLNDQAEATKVMDGIEEIIMADMSIDPDEMEVYRFLKKELITNF